MTNKEKFLAGQIFFVAPHRNQKYSFCTMVKCLQNEHNQFAGLFEGFNKIGVLVSATTFGKKLNITVPFDKMIFQDILVNKPATAKNQTNLLDIIDQVKSETI